MAALGGRFALLMRVTGSWDALAKLEARLPAVGEELGLSLIQQRTRAARAEKPHCGKTGVPFMYSTTSFSFTSAAIRSNTGFWAMGNPLLRLMG